MGLWEPGNPVYTLTLTSSPQDPERVRLCCVVVTCFSGPTLQRSPREECSAVQTRTQLSHWPNTSPPGNRL
jgi:hypothetical protein